MFVNMLLGCRLSVAKQGLHALDVSPESVKSRLDVFVSAVYLCDVVYLTGAIGTQCGDKQGDTCTDVGACHAAGAQLLLMVVADNHGTMRVAQNDLRTHVDNLVNEK